MCPKKSNGSASFFYITVSQLDGCTFNIVPVIRTVRAAGASYTVTVTASGGNCGWTASENSAWISLSRTAGAGTGPVGITVSANSGPARTATVSIAGRVHTVNQDPGLPVVTVTATDAYCSRKGWISRPRHLSHQSHGQYPCNPKCILYHERHGRQRQGLHGHQ
jgi:hypothetical protein